MSEPKYLRQGRNWHVAVGETQEYRDNFTKVFGVKKTCWSCRHTDSRFEKEPCSSCENLANWEPEDEGS